jgi:hypothetical protein
LIIQRRSKEDQRRSIQIQRKKCDEIKENLVKMGKKIIFDIFYERVDEDDVDDMR